MIKKALSCHLSALSLVFLLCSVCFAQGTSSTELISKAKEYDGKTVVYQGEVIGDVMRRGDFAWVNVNDGKSAIGIWTDYALTKDITYRGSYKFKGDIIEVTGTFNRACAVHGGDLDIHAQAIRKVEAGMPVPERITPAKRNATVVLLGVLASIWILKVLKSKSKPKSKA